VVLFFNPDGGLMHSWVLLPLLHILGKKTAMRMTLADSSDPSGLARRRFGRIRLLPYRLHHRVISISTALSLSYEAVFGRDRRLIRITNGVDTRRFSPASRAERDQQCRELGLDPALKYCIFVGRISHRKGVDLIVDAWRDVAARFPDARLLLVGPKRDEYRQVEDVEFIRKLEATIREHDLESSIVWTGHSDSPEQYFRVADAFLFASRREGLGNVVLEAMASAVPIVTTRLENITEDLIDAGVEGLVTTRDPREFADAIIRVLSSPELARDLGARARRKADTEFSIARTAERYLEVLRAL
jgi:glycosyltransferase involved in cell wall biosynthesis